MSCGVGQKCSLDPSLLWLWCRPAATAQIQPLAWEFPYASGVAPKSQKLKKKKTSRENSRVRVEALQLSLDQDKSTAIHSDQEKEAETWLGNGEGRDGGRVRDCCLCKCSEIRLLPTRAMKTRLGLEKQPQEVLVFPSQQSRTDSNNYVFLN